MASSPPHARWRSQVISYGRSNPEPSARPFDASPRVAGTPGAWPWAALLRRVFDFDVLWTCPTLVDTWVKLPMLPVRADARTLWG